MVRIPRLHVFAGPVPSMAISISAVAALVVISGVWSGGHPGEAAFPGANGKIAFMSGRGGNYEIYSMNSDGTGQTNITNHPANDRDPAWSPDGTRIAFTSTRDDPDPLGCVPCNIEVYVMNADGSGVTRVTDHPAVDIHPSWSPDGSKIAFGSTRDGNHEIYILDADGSDVTRVTNHPAQDTDPAWSPDGERIAFVRYTGGDWEVYVTATDGSDEANLSNSHADGDPAWSPDGSQIVFRRSLPGNPEFYVMNADGGGQTNITNHPANEQDPAWSPDGTKIVFYSSGGGRSGGTYTMGPDGSGVMLITTDARFNLDWQPVIATPTPTASPTPTATPTPTSSVTPPADLTQGDVNCDGDVTSVDSLGILRFVAGMSPLIQQEPCPDIGTGAGGFFGDLDCKNLVNSVDALGVLRFVAALSPLTQQEPCTDIGDAPATGT